MANREPLVEKLRQTFAWAASAGLPIVSSVESHRPSEPLHEFPLHCIDGTPGQEKLPFTLLQPWTIVETDNYLSLPPDLRENYRQIIFRKRTKDILSNPKADRFLTGMVADAIILFGVGIERAVKGLALGLLAQQVGDGDQRRVRLLECGRRRPRITAALREGCPAGHTGRVDRRTPAGSPRYRRPVRVPATAAAAVENRHHPVSSRSRRRARTDVSER